eukprot:COSAG04_NODE_8939_length_915_cov_1.102941_1_plen_20_part_10
MVVRITCLVTIISVTQCGCA